MTTLATLQTGLASIQYVVAIEGFEYLLTDGSTSAAVTAWSGTEWTQAIGGLQVSGSRKQTLKPWSPEVDTDHLTIAVQQDESDTFGKLLFASNNGAETTLTTALDCNDTTVAVKSTADFASSGSIHIGTEHITYTGKTATTFTTCTRGRYAPLKANTESAQRFGRAHPLAAVGDGYVVQPRVTSKQRTWIGRWVGIWIHTRTSGSTLETIANAYLFFAGRIVGFRDETNGLSYIEIESATGAIKDCVLFRDQWTARVAEGIILREGEKFACQDIDGSTTLSPADLVVVASGASGAYQMNAGRYTLETLADALNQWFRTAKVTDSDLNFDWAWSPLIAEEDKLRSQFRWTGGGVGLYKEVKFWGPPDVLDFMGFTADHFRRTLANQSNLTQQYLSDSTPCRTLMRTGGENTIEIESVAGTWWNNQAYLPARFGAQSLATGSYALVQIGEDGRLMLCKEETAGSTISTVITSTPSLDDLLSGDIDAAALGIHGFRRVKADEDAELTLRQVAFITGDFADVLAMLLASTGTSAYNHATYDTLPDHIGAAIPWQILGSTFTESAEHLAEAGADLEVMLEKPKKLTEAVGPDMVARLASFIWKSQCIAIAHWSLPAAVVSQHTLTESNKATAIDAHDDQRTVAVESDDYLINAVKLLYNRRQDGKSYSSTLNIIDRTSQYETGLHRPISIELANTFSGNSSANATVEKLADHLASMLHVFSKPLRIVRRTISPEYYEGVAPGDICVVSDDFLRDPDTGERGISNRPGMIMSHEVDYGGYEIDSGRIRPPLGQIDIVLWPRSMVVAYSPCAQVDDTASNGGYDSGTRTLTFYAHEHSGSADATDLSHFNATDAVRIIEIDPDDPASPQTWTTTISSINTGANTCVVADALTGWSSTTYYRMISANYSSATTTQKAEVYQADDADNMIVDDNVAFEYGNNPTVYIGFDEGGDELPALYAQAAYGDGAPLDVGYERDAIRLVNNLTLHRTAPMGAMLTDHSDAIAGHTRVVLALIPFFCGGGDTGAGTRSIIIRVWCRSGNGSATNGYVTVSRLPPYGDEWYNDTGDKHYFFERPFKTSSAIAVSSTTWGASSQIEFDASIADQTNGLVYITIEGEPQFQTRGLCMLHVGPYQSP